MSACVASIFGLDIGTVPRFNPETWGEELDRWLNDRGYGYVNVAFSGEQKAGIPRGYTIGAIPTRSSGFPEGWMHSVICLDGKVVWDPLLGVQPGTERAEEYTIIYRLRTEPAQQPASLDLDAAALRKYIASDCYFFRECASYGKGTGSTIDIADAALQSIRDFQAKELPVAESSSMPRCWMGMETAPRDYSWVLIAAFDDDGQPIYVIASRWEGFWQSLGLREKPSHWMHLPLPPSVDRDGEDER